MGISRSVSNIILSILSFVVLSACNTANQEAAMTMVVQTFEARGTGTAVSAEATQVGATEIVLAEIAEATDIAQVEIVAATAIALTEAAKATATPTQAPTATLTPTLDPQNITYLADMKPIYVAAFRGTFWVRQIGDLDTGDPLTGEDGTVYENGLYIEAGFWDELGNYYWDVPSTLTYYLNGDYSSFTATLALQNKLINYSWCTAGNIFSIYLDNEKVYESATVFNSSLTVTIDVTDVQRLKLRTRHVYKASNCASIWGDPYLVNADTDTTKPSTAITDTPEPIIAVTSTPATTTGTIQGRVYWASTGDPVEGVSLSLPERGEVSNTADATSDAEGQFEILDLTPGAYSFHLNWKFDFDAGDTPCAGLDQSTMITGDWFTVFATLNAGGNMMVAIQNDEVEINAGVTTTFDIVFTCSEPELDIISKIGQDFGMTLFAMSGRWGIEFEDGSVISLVGEQDVYVITWSAPRQVGISWDANVIANRILTLVDALEFPESMFQIIIDDLVISWNHYLESPDYEMHYQHDGYEITIYEDETSTAFDPTHPFNEGGFHIVLSMEKTE